MKLAAQVVGVFAVIAFLLSYQQEKRKGIILWNSLSRCLYIIQYILLGAYEGAALDVLGTVSSVAAHNKDKGFVLRHIKLVFVLVNVIILGVGLLLYENIFSLFPIAGVLLHTCAFWITNEKTIRIISFLGSPFWLVYNLVSCAYFSAVGDILTMVSIAVAICRYDIRKVSEKDNV